MKPNEFVKVVVAMVALCLGVIVITQLFQAHSAHASPVGRMDYVQVLCSKCVIEGVTETWWGGRLVLFDSRNGDIWAYSDEALSGNAKPIYVGKLAELGQPVVKK